MKRRYFSAARLAQLERSLSHRDQAIIGSLDRLRVATTVQLRRLHFADLTEGSAAKQAPKALRRLEKLGLVCPLERPLGGVRAGSAATVWSLDVGGQKLASVCGPAGGQRTRRPWTPGVSFLTHRLSVTETYVELNEAASAGAIKVVTFDAEPLCWRRYAAPHGGFEHLKPDAFIRVVSGDYERGAFVEMDRSTESSGTIARKATAYRRAWEAGREQQRWGYFPRVVFAVPDERRKEIIVDVCARQPAEAHPLFRVVLTGDLLAALVGGDS